MNPATMTPKQKNSHYGMIKLRYDARCDELFKLGFQLDRIKEYNLSIWSRRDPVFRNRQQTIESATVLYADELVWADHLASFRGE
jgi:hypothetical protein